MKLKTILMTTTLMIFCLPSLVSAQKQPEEILLTTYYPSPSGRYEELRAERVGVGGTYGVGGGPAISDGVPLIVNDCVGIGTHSPEEKLEVESNTDQIGITNIFGGSSIIGHDGTGPFIRIDDAADDWSLRDSGGNQLITALESGDVGIGRVPTDNMRLDVTGTFRVYSTGTAAIRLESGGVACQINNNGGDFSIDDGTGGALLTIDGTGAEAGNTGIGTAPSADYRLLVVGGALNAEGGLIIHVLGGLLDNEAIVDGLEATLLTSAEDGQMWLRREYP